MCCVVPCPSLQKQANNLQKQANNLQKQDWAIRQSNNSKDSSNAIRFWRKNVFEFPGFYGCVVAYSASCYLLAIQKEANNLQKIFGGHAPGPP